MKQGSLLVNGGRAGLVDTPALIDALNTEHLAGAAMDVYDVEPAINHPLARFDNVILTPHTAWSTPGASMRTLRIATANILAYLEGKPENVVE